jgi:hypothetical protein
MRFVNVQTKGDLDECSFMYKYSQEAGKLWMSPVPIANYIKPKDPPTDVQASNVSARIRWPS